MRTSLNNIKTIDEFLGGNMSPENELLFQAELLINNQLASDVFISKRHTKLSDNMEEEEFGKKFPLRRKNS